MAQSASSLKWTERLILQTTQTTSLVGDKIILPQSALESLLAVAPVISIDDQSDHTANTSFDSYNPYSLAAARQARAQYRREQPQLPHPLTFRLVNPSNGRTVYAGIKEFSADEGHVGLSTFLTHALAFDQKDTLEKLNVDSETTQQPFHGNEQLVPRVSVHAEQVPRGKFVKLRPLEAGYDPDDWKSLLEEYLRKNYTTLTRGEILVVPKGQTETYANDDFRFLIDSFEPVGNAICIVDTDLEVDIEALNEEQARETLQKIAAKKFKAPQASDGGFVGGELTYTQQRSGQVSFGEYTDYELTSWDRSQVLEIEVAPIMDNAHLELFVSPQSTRQRSRPRIDEHAFADVDDTMPKKIRIAPTNIALENAEKILISVYSPLTSSGLDTSSKVPIEYIIQAKPSGGEATDAKSLGNSLGENETHCSNCKKAVPKQSIVLHENFCFRNNILCQEGCGSVFQKRSKAYQGHWHCEKDTSFGNSEETHKRHNEISHQASSCQSCGQNFPNVLQLARHRTSDCPGKLILCRFCHLVVPQGGDLNGLPDAEVIVSGLTPHELADGSRTTECHLCQRIVRLRDLETHMKHHDLERVRRAAPRMCRNVNCGRTLDGISKNGDTRANSRMGHGAGNDIGLCSVCFGPLYVSMHDPEGKALKRRVERKYLSQLLSGCGKSWCQNKFCKTGMKNQDLEVPSSAKDASILTKSFVDGLNEGTTSLHFCVDESSQQRRELARLLAAEYHRMPGSKTYEVEWCLGALEAENGNLDRARDWLKNFAPAIGE